MPTIFRPRFLVIGAGLGGVAAAIRLARAGSEVTVIDRQEKPGGKMGELEWEGFRWDTGPSLLTMPHVLEDLWAQAGRKLKHDLELIPLETTCRYRWQDGTVINEDAEFWQRPEVAAFLRHAKGIHDLSVPTFLSKPPGAWFRALGFSGLRHLAHLPKLMDPRPLARLIEKSFPGDPHVAQIFARFATYNGSSPYRTPSAFAIIPYAQAAFGGWYVRGGMRRVAAAMIRLAESLGVRFEAETEAVRFERNAAQWTVFVRDVGGGPISPRRCDGVVCNQDALAATRRFLDPSFKPRHQLSTSGFVIHAAVGKTYPELAHHNILFSQDYPDEFADLFDQRIPTDNPTIYIAASCKTEAGRAPEGCENWFVLVNAPAAVDGFNWDLHAPRYADRILGKLPAFGLEDPRPHLRWMKTFTPEQFAERDLSWGGALYGYASHGPRSAFIRPPMLSRERGLVFTGGSTHPGGGVPLVVLSGQMAASLVMQQLTGRALPVNPPLAAPVVDTVPRS